MSRVWRKDIGNLSKSWGVPIYVECKTKMHLQIHIKGKAKTYQICITSFGGIQFRLNVRPKSICNFISRAWLGDVIFVSKSFRYTILVEHTAKSICNIISRARCKYIGFASNPWGNPIQVDCTTKKHLQLHIKGMVKRYQICFKFLRIFNLG